MSLSDAVPILASVLGAGLSLLLVFGLCAIVFCGPLMAWSIMRNIRAIRVQFERLNDAIDGTRGASGAGPLHL